MNTKIENLPDNLKEFNCSCNGITKIENLPENLQEFYCSHNGITKIENLPKNLQEFYCSRNGITKIENLPKNLKNFNCSWEKIEYFDNIPISELNNWKNIKWYQNIKKFQRRCRASYQIRNKAASIIQKGCENWLWKPICNDGTIGIIPLLEYKKIQEELKN